MSFSSSDANFSSSVSVDILDPAASESVVSAGMERNEFDTCSDAEALKVKGNEAFAREEYESALEIYRKATTVAKASDPISPGKTALGQFFQCTSPSKRCMLMKLSIEYLLLFP